MTPAVAEVHQTDRIAFRAWVGGDPRGEPIVFLHGAPTDGRAWLPALQALPAKMLGFAPDLRGFGGTEALPVDARLGLDDLAADVRAAVAWKKLGKHHLVAHGFGAAVAWRLLVRYFLDVETCCVIAPFSPYGYGGAEGSEGRPAPGPAGAALANPDEVRRLADGDRADHPDAPRGVLRRQAGRSLPDEEALVDAAITTVVDDDHYPGDAGGRRGVLNAASRAWYRGFEAAEIRRKPPLLWLRGALDTEPAGAPGQPVQAQIRHFLSQYRQGGGRADEVVLPGCAHLPHLEDPAAFWAAWLHFRASASGSTPSLPSRR